MSVTAARRSSSASSNLNAFIVARETEAEARETVEEIIDKADVEAVKGFGEAVKQAGQSAADKRGMWEDSDFKDLVRYNDGFRTGLIGRRRSITWPRGAADSSLARDRAWPGAGGIS